MIEQNTLNEGRESSTDSTPDSSARNGSADSAGTGTHGGSENEMIDQFPPEIATLLVIAGIAGVLLPGPFGTPLLIAGGVVLWPKTFRPIEKWFCRKFPAAHREGVRQIKQFVDDLNRRFPPK